MEELNGYAKLFEPAVIIHQGLIAETLSEAYGVALIDELGNVTLPSR